MKWSFKIAEVFGISIKVHALFLLVLAYVGWSNAALGGVRAGIEAALFFVIIFLFVLLHELGHSVTAMHYGVRVRDIVLLPIGGVARLESLPKKPLQEVWVALAGPAVNFFFVLVFILLGAALGRPLGLPALHLSDEDLLASLIALNLIMGTFNLLPAFPMDGGRVLRGLLAMRMSYVRATQIASGVGQALALLMGLAGVFYFQNIWMAIIAAFIFMGAGGEQQMVRLQHSIAGVSVAQVMSQRVLTLHPFDTLQRAIEYFYQSTQQDFPVVENERLVGMMQKEDIQNAMRLGRNAELIAAMMRTRFTAVQPQAVLEKVYAEMAARNLTAVPVVENGRFAGLLTLENIGRYMIVAAVEEQLGKQRE